MGMKLFDENGDSDNDDISKIEIDKKFARRYEHNNKREDLHRLEELKKKGIVDESDSDSEESEEDDELIDTRENDLDFFNALIKVKNQDPILKEKDAKLFSKVGDSDEDDEEEVVKKEKKKDKPMYLKDVQRKHLIEDGPEYDDEGSNHRVVKSYADEQEELRRSFLDAARDDDDDDGDLLKEKANDEGDDIGDGKDDMIQKKLDEYFGDDEELDENAKFLKGFFKNTMWVDKGKGKAAFVDEELARVSEDEEEVDRQEDYERDFNFRYEENAGDRVLGHSRAVEGSVRKKVNPRKAQRERKEDRMAKAELERKEELKHMKNLKKKEYLEKINKVRAVAGFGDRGAFELDEDYLKEEFDPKAHDEKMKAVFNENYDHADDPNPEFCSEDEEDGEDFKKPDFDKEDLLLSLPEGWDKDDEDEEEGEEGKKKRKRKPSKESVDEDLEEKYNMELEDELHKLDYEGTIGDLKTRFPYRKVKPKRFGLSWEEILLMDDLELNQYVSLKKIAPYTEKEWKVPSIKRYELKLKNKELLQDAKLGKHGKKKGLKGDDGKKSVAVKEDKEDDNEQVDDDTGSTSRQTKRRRRQRELKMSQLRLQAYGKIDPKPKRY